MFEERFLEQALEEIQKLTEENREFRRQISLYEKFVQDVKELLCEGETMESEKV